MITRGALMAPRKYLTRKLSQYQTHNHPVILMGE